MNAWRTLVLLTKSTSLGHEGRRSRASGRFEGRRRDNLVQRTTTYRSSVRTSHRSDAQLGDPRSRGTTTHVSQSLLRLSRAIVDPRLQRLRFRNVQRGSCESATAASKQLVVLATASSPRRQDASAISARRCLQQKRQVRCNITSIKELPTKTLQYLSLSFL